MIFGRGLPLSAELLDIISYLLEVGRRAVDGTVVPLFVDYTNNRVLIGATVASTSNIGKVEITGDVRVLGTANGIILPDAGGTTKLCRMRVVYDSTSGNFLPVFDTIA